MPPTTEGGIFPAWAATSRPRTDPAAAPARPAVNSRAARHVHLASLVGSDHTLLTTERTDANVRDRNPLMHPIPEEARMPVKPFSPSS